jgi:hypothetical protein
MDRCNEKERRIPKKIKRVEKYTNLINSTVNI